MVIPMSEQMENYMEDLRKWLAETADLAPEEMADFFSNRLSGYEQHMAVWEQSYQRFAGLLPKGCRNVLDLGCGTGLELDRIWQKYPDLCVTGVDLCPEMLKELEKKHPEKQLTTVCADYFQYDLGCNRWDAVISFESLHHFLPDAKGELYQKIHASLKEGGVFLLGDYTACCEEEETLLRSEYQKRRKRFGIPENQFIHFDIPLTLEHELALLRKAGFRAEKVLDAPNEATLITAEKVK